jgi:transcription initiation factor TFIIIB Brf1 subunit/transcription initiation factor TFIIB
MPEDVLSSKSSARCKECAGEVVDVGDELVCRACGIVYEKLVVEPETGGRPSAGEYAQHLGGYLGPKEFGFKERFASGLTDSGSNFRYLKLLSDNAGRGDSTSLACIAMIDRVCGRLSLPRIVSAEAARLSKKLMAVKRGSSHITTGAVAALSIIAACRVEGVSSTSVREVVGALRAMGRRVKTSSLIQLSLNSPVRILPRPAEDYVGRVIVRLESKLREDHDRADCGASLQRYMVKLREAALEVLGATGPEARAGHNPCALAASAVYAGEVILSKREGRHRQLTQRTVAECAGVAEYTVREQFGEVFSATVTATYSTRDGTIRATPNGQRNAQLAPESPFPPN